MKDILIFCSTLSVFFFSMACQPGSGKSDHAETIFDQEEKKNEFLPTDDKNLFLFTQVPASLTGCIGTFARTEEEFEAEEFVFSTDLETSCVLAVNERFLQIDLTSRKVMNTDRDLYRFEGKGYLINLELREIERLDKYRVKYRGQLRITDHSKLQKVVYITGIVEC